MAGKSAADLFGGLLPGGVAGPPGAAFQQLSSLSPGLGGRHFPRLFPKPLLSPEGKTAFSRFLLIFLMNFDTWVSVALVTVS